MRISDLFRSKKIRSTSLVALAALSWAMGSGIPEAVMTDGRGTVASAGWVESAYAVGKEGEVATKTSGAAAEVKSDQSKDGTEAALKAVNAIIELVNMLFLPATILAGWLLSPDWTFGEIFGLRPIIHSLWVLVSNVVYVIFAFLLIAMAFMNIFGQGGEHYAMKKALPRFITGILIVPFTWFAVSGILSVTNLLTASVLRLPADMLTSMSPDKAEFKFKMPKSCTLNFKKIASGDSKGEKAVPGKILTCDKGEPNLVSLKDALASDQGAYGVLNIYAYDIFRVQDIKIIDDVNLQSAAGVVDMLTSVGLWGIFLIVYALLVLALTFALFTRAFYLWLIAIFSPLFGLFYYLEGKGGFAEDLKKKLSFSTFVSLAMVPVYVSAALGFGLLFVKMASVTELKPENSTFFAEGTEPGKNDGDASFRIGPKDPSKSTLIKMEGIPIGMAKSAGTAEKVGKWAIQLGATAIGKIIVSILAVTILWMSVMAALNSSDITKTAVEPIAKFGTDMGKLMASAPKYIPLHTTADGHKMTMAGLWGMAGNISSSIQNAANKWGLEMGTKIGQSIAEKMGMGMSEVANEIVKFKNQNKTLADDKKVQWADFTDMLKRVPSLSTIAQDRQVANEISERVGSYTQIKDEKLRKEIQEKINSGNEAKIAEGFRDLEHALWAENVWGGHTFSGIPKDADDFIKANYQGSKAAGKPSPTATTITVGNNVNVTFDTNSVNVPGVASFQAGAMNEKAFSDALGSMDPADKKKIIETAKQKNPGFFKK